MIDRSSLGQLTGKDVTGPDGTSIGKVSDVYEATDGSGGTFATVKTGLFGSGSSFFPLDAADIKGDSIQVPFTKDVVKDAPRVEDDEELTAPEEQRLYDYYSQYLGGTTQTATTTDYDKTPDVDRDGDARGTVGHDTSGPTTDSAMTRSEEQLRVGTEKVETGRARLRKFVTTETETRTVPVSREEIRVEREPITDANRGDAMGGPAFSEEEHEVVLNAERPVVQKEAVPVERVRVDKDVTTDEETITEEVRKEQIDLDAGTEVRGDRR